MARHSECYRQAAERRRQKEGTPGRSKRMPKEGRTVARQAGSPKGPSTQIIGF